MDETPEQKYKRLSEQIQQTILRNYPNPERRGCPGSKIVREVAGRRELIEDDLWQHITHCSPCYAEFLKYKEYWRKRRRRWRDPQVLGGVLAAGVAACAGTYYLTHRNVSPNAPAQVATLEYKRAVLNLKEVSATRGATGSRPNSQAPTLRRERLDLTVILPFGSEAGMYDIQLQDSEHRALISGEARAVIQDGNTSLNVKWDLTKYAAGNYVVAWRRRPWEWISADILLR